VPQHREHIIILGFKEKPLHNPFDDLNLLEKGNIKLSAILHPEDGTEEEEPPYTTGKDGKVNSKYTLTPHLWDYLQKYAEKHRKAGNGFGYGLVKGTDIARTLSPWYHKDGGEILIDRGGKKRPRRLTPRECARLMGFDDSFKIPVSDTQAYRQFGSSVVVPMITEVAKILVQNIITH
jgi:DNA (cytosine-5)-methyltransferase 1